jgi:hypothetical protein
LAPRGAAGGSAAAHRGVTEPAESARLFRWKCGLRSVSRTACASISPTCPMMPRCCSSWSATWRRRSTGRRRRWRTRSCKWPCATPRSRRCSCSSPRCVGSSSAARRRRATPTSWRCGWRRSRSRSPHWRRRAIRHRSIRPPIPTASRAASRCRSICRARCCGMNPPAAAVPAAAARCMRSARTSARSSSTSRRNSG